MAKPTYPDGYNPPERGRCEICGCLTKGWTRDWLSLCPEHWQTFMTRVGLA